MVMSDAGVFNSYGGVFQAPSTTENVGSAKMAKSACGDHTTTATETATMMELVMPGLASNSSDDTDSTDDTSSTDSSSDDTSSTDSSGEEAAAAGTPVIAAAAVTSSPRNDAVPDSIEAGAIATAPAPPPAVKVAKSKRSVRTPGDDGFSDDMVLQRSAKKSQSPFISKRVGRLAGMTVGQALQGFSYEDRVKAEDAKKAANVVGSDGIASCMRAYRYADLKYDISSGYLVDPRAPTIVKAEKLRMLLKRQKAKAKKRAEKGREDFDEDFDGGEFEGDDEKEGAKKEDESEKAKGFGPVGSLAGLTVGSSCQVLWRDEWYAAKVAAIDNEWMHRQLVYYDVVYEEDGLLETAVPCSRIRSLRQLSKPMVSAQVVPVRPQQAAVVKFAKVGAGAVGTGSCEQFLSSAVGVTNTTVAQYSHSQVGVGSMTGVANIGGTGLSASATSATNQPPLLPGTRVEVEFEDEVGDSFGGAALVKCCFDGAVVSQHAAGTIIEFDDGDVQDLDLTVVPFGVMNGGPLGVVNGGDEHKYHRYQQQHQQHQHHGMAVEAEAEVKKAPSRSTPKRKQPRGSCGQCDGCHTPNCGECNSCKDMARFGGSGRLKQRCNLRVCSSTNAVDAVEALAISTSGEGAYTTVDPGTCRPPTKKTKRDPNAPKPALSAYNIFSTGTRTELKEAQPDSGPMAISVELGRRWKELSDEDKKQWNEKAAADKERYGKEMVAYTPPADIAGGEVGTPIRKIRRKLVPRSGPDHRCKCHRKKCIYCRGCIKKHCACGAERDHTTIDDTGSSDDSSSTASGDSSSGEEAVPAAAGIAMTAAATTTTSSLQNDAVLADVLATVVVVGSPNPTPLPPCAVGSMDSYISQLFSSSNTRPEDLMTRHRELHGNVALV
jgi:hypothetical protein